MKKAPILASRRLDITTDDGGSSKITVRIRHPFRYRGNFACEYEIVRDGKTTSKMAGGVDAMQALLLVIAGISADLRPLTERLSWHEMRGVSGFPCAVVFPDETDDELGKDIELALERHEARAAQRNARHRSARP